MVWTTRTVTVLVLLQLHAIDTRKENIDDSWIEDPVKSTSSTMQPSTTEKPPPPLHQKKKILSREDEDLLDLMVRIAESPAEWERIHRILYQLGVDKETNTDVNEKLTMTSNQSRGNQENNKSVTHHNSTTTDKFTINNSQALRSINKTEKSVTQLTETSTVPNYGSDKEMLTNQYETVDTDTGWPDFREAILMKINRHNVKIKENNIMETGLLENNLIDTSLSKYFKVDKQDNEQDVNSFPESNSIEPVVNFIPTNNMKESISWKDPHIIRSRLYEDPKILEFPTKEHTLDKNTTSYQNSSADSNDIMNRTLRPIFLYHRVTTSPQERKNSAFIAVSVVKLSSLASPATDSAPVAQLENTDDHWNSRHSPHSAKVRTKSLTDYSRRKRPHSSRKMKHHTRDHRHHHTESYSHL